MAIDGSFRLESALERFLARCPKLGFCSQFDSLAKKGCMVTEEEVVKALAEVFLHPSYTIPLVGCFRPIAPKIVDKVVVQLKAVAQPRPVGYLRSNSDDTSSQSDHLDEESALDKAVAGGVSVIDFFVRHGRGLDLHESACLALCRTLDLAPFLLGSVLNYFEFAPPPYERILTKEAVSELSMKVVDAYLRAMRTSCHLLIMKPEMFSKLWDWSCFLDLVILPIDLSLGNGAEFENDIADIRWCGIQILSLILKLSDRATARFGVGAEEAFSCLLRWEEFWQDLAIEKAGSYIGTSNPTQLGYVSGQTDFNQLNCLQSFCLNSLALSQSHEMESSTQIRRLHEMEPSTRSRRLATRDDKSAGNPFVMTVTLKKSFEMVLLAVSQKWPVLLYGPAGSGKSALIRKLAQDSGNHVLSIHMDDQIDGKTLVGTFVCTEQPGEFRWQPGSLTQAVLKGFWVVFEDIDKAPSDVLPMLLPLLEGASTFVTSHGEVIRVAESFRLFSTISSFKCDVSHSTGGGSVLGVLWRKIMIGPPNTEDLENIVSAWYPKLEFVAKKLVETFENINTAPQHQFASSQSGTWSTCSSHSRFSLRDLLKWCKRLDGLSTDHHHCIYQEAVDIFASFSSSAEKRLTTVKYIATMFPDSETLNIRCYKPIIQDLSEGLKVGRVTLQRAEKVLYDRSRFVEIRSSLLVLERIARSIEYNEPVLLVGETGTGKTTLVQNIATWLGQRLTVLNLSQQSDVADLLGGFRPMDARSMFYSLYNEFEALGKTFNLKDGHKVFKWLKERLSSKNWEKFLSGLKKLVELFRKEVEKERSGSCKKRKKCSDEEEKLKDLRSFSLRLENVHQQIASTGMVFTFVEGAFVTALRNGEWILLDEVNLAPPEILARVIGVLEGESGSLCLAERGDVNDVRRHPGFRIFACMNPATDAGKRDLPYSLRSRFTEYFVDDVLDDSDLDLFVRQFLGSRDDTELVKRIVCFYKEAKKESDERLQDGANQKPQYSLRSLYRALEYLRKAKSSHGFDKAIYDGFCMFFLTLLDGPSAKIMNHLIVKHLLRKGESPPPPLPFDRYLKVEENLNSSDFMNNYVLTKSVKEHLRNLARAIFIKRYPVLLQGPTSSGKTSLVKYLASITGHEFVRINNHEHTDLQEYLGSYITDSSGKLVFHEGVLVKAVRNGHWIVLDELNLAPSDVLEALNRLLDDNREIFVPELRETVSAHPDFMLFATQNPPTFYGGRKLLSRAFRNRFVEIHVGEIPEDELSTILKQRCQIPDTYAVKMVEVLKDLQLHRQSSKVFAGKHGYITPRDLFRWADRFRVFGKSREDLACDGYYLLAERLRDEGEKSVVLDVLEKHLRVKLVKDNLYGEKECPYPDLKLRDDSGWTKSMERLYFLVRRCYELREPVLLVGETGGGKTTVCQLLSEALSLKLHILNCHQYTETSDFLGGFYPIRDRSKLLSEFKYLIEQLKLSKAFIHFAQNTIISSDIGQAASTLNQLDEIIIKYTQGLVSCADVTKQDIDTFQQMKWELVQLHQKWQAIFVWQDGPIVQSMRAGDLFLVDEISLADDSVLERLNSVLEPERKLSLAEKGGTVLEEVTAHRNFFVLATMNPGGDYGKKELSPALRNRFTEIWVTPVSDSDELRTIALRGFSNPKLSRIVDPMINFWEWFNQLQIGRMLTVRDLLSWVAFINVTEECLGAEYAFLHGAFLLLLDGLSLGTGISRKDGEELRERCFSFLLELLKVDDTDMLYWKLARMENYGWGDLGITVSGSADILSDKLFGIDPFYIEKGYENCEVGRFEFLAPTTSRNALRVLRAMQLPKPVLLEGSPGVGKTSLIVALGKYSGHRVVRINLSEQTDIMDLLGSDLPVDSDEGMKFAWSDGILLQALKQGSWVLLDELNLAPQSVLEGLNAILDHRAEVFVPELGLTFRCPPSFRVFACQNPSCQGGGRKGLPKSFLNRFTKVYVDELVEDDYLFICSSLYPSIPRDMLSNLISFNRRLHEDTMLYNKFGQDGSPWEFNLRDVIRSCQIIQGTPAELKNHGFLNILYVQRMRTAADRREVLQLYEHVFGQKLSINPYPRVQLNPHYLIVGNASIKRNYTRSSKISSSQLKILPEIRHSLEAAAHCIQNQWLCILIGPSSCGKTSLIRILAQLTGNVLNELNLSSATDISELLGCFEQYNAFRNFCSVVAQVECFVNEYCNLQLEASLEAFFNERRDLISSWLAFLSRVDTSFMSSSPSSDVENWKSIVNSLSFLMEIIEQLKLDLANKVLPVSWSSQDLDRTMNTILKLQDPLKRSFSAKFEWVAGLLIKAIENGEWIVLENANLCNPTVLDRINSLVEPFGTITVNECGSVDGKPLVVHPHPNFRMFLTVNPNFGEVSRAMRNRGVEIYMMEPYWLFDEEGGHGCEELQRKDAKSFLVLSGIPGGKLVDSMAEAHVYVRHEGLRLNVRITYLELAHWIQLFQQLLMNGNQPLWSLQISWEHTYLSSLGETDGRNIISHAHQTYLSVAQLYESDSSPGRVLCLRGGLPMPLKLRDFVWYSKEASVKQNSMYLQFLGAQFAGCEFGMMCNNCHVDQDLAASGYAGTYVMDSKMLHKITFPKVSNEINLKSECKTEFNSNLANKMLLFAANWTVEQATENDFHLYLLWFSWLVSRFQPYCHFLCSFLASLKEEMNHPIWKYIVSCHKDLSSMDKIDLDLHPIPMLSLEFVELTAPDKCLSDAINCVGILRINYLQWHAESRHNYIDESIMPFLESLRALEEEILNKIVGSSSFDVLIQLYTDLLESHMLFWSKFTSSQFECLMVSWRSLVKAATKLHEFFPSKVEVVLKESKNLDKFHSERSLLWAHGGHPLLPWSAKLYDQQQQLLKKYELVWPMKSKLWKQAHDETIKIVASSDPELRSLALQGVCMSSYITGIYDEDDGNVVQQVGMMYEMLETRMQSEIYRLESRLDAAEHALLEANSAVCCVFYPETLCVKSGFDGWLDTLPIIDNVSCSLDMELLELLQKLLVILVVEPSKLQPILESVYSLLESALKYSLSSMRPPQTLIPHQKILWTIDAWTSVDAVNSKVAGFVLEMWYWWHSFLWSHCLFPVPGFSKIDGYDIPLPDMLFQPVKIATISHILQSSFAISDYAVQSLKLKVASCNLWRGSAPRTNIPTFLLSGARSLFQQIIYAHRKSFTAENFEEIKSILYSSQKNIHMLDDIKLDKIQRMRSLIESSSHKKLKSSVNSFIEPLLRKLYLSCSSTDFYSNLGFAWFHIGGLRFNLLLSRDDLDPAMKYSCKLEQLEEKILSLEVEMKVRQECEYLAGRFSSGEADKRTEALQKLEIERKRLKKKIAFRRDPKKFKELKIEFDEFHKKIESFMELVNKIEVMDLQQVVKQACNCQEIATSFIDLLSKEYAEYIDIAQPVQVATYEMKLGLSLVLSGALLKNFLYRINEERIDLVMESIYSFMRFPSGCLSETVSVNLKNWPLLSSHDIYSPMIFWALDNSLLEKLVTVSSEDGGKVSLLQLKAALHRNFLVRFAHYVANAKLMDSASFDLLDKIFYEFANIWMNMKVQVKTKEDCNAQQYKFRTRAFKIESVMEVDISGLGKCSANDSYSEWQEFMAEGESNETMDDGLENENLEEEWNLMQDPLNDIINIHNQLFGSMDLVQNPGNFQIKDADRLHSFIDSYSLGVGMIKGLGGLFTSSLDAKLVPEHLLCLCLEHEKKFVSAHKSACRFNFYKDSNAPMLATMVKSLTALQQRICTLLREWEDHPGLQRVLDVIKMLLDIPLNTPLAKALSGLQFLLSRVRMLQEDGCKFSVSDKLKPIIELGHSWQKMELECWPALLDEVQDQYEINAGKLWFPLFSVLHRGHSSDIAGYAQSLVEFIQTSSIGEFRKRLQLLFAFLGQLSTGSSLGSYSSPLQKENLSIFYNAFGFYVQFLPIVMEQIEANRRNIEIELKELIKLCRWEPIDSHLSIDITKRTRQKLRKLIQKYTELLQQPVFLSQEGAQKGVSLLVQGSKPLNDICDKSIVVLKAVLDERSVWYATWRKKVNGALQNFQLGVTPEIKFPITKDITNIISQCLACQSACPLYQDEWKNVWRTVERICITTIGCRDLWKDMKRSVGKKRALSELLKLLESSGLSGRKFENMEISSHSSWLFDQPPNEVQHLLLTQSRLSYAATGAAASSDVECLSRGNSDADWKTVNEFYFKSLASVQQIHLRHHEDFTSEQVYRSISFLNHLMIIQKEQRAAAYEFAEHLKRLREYVFALENLLSDSTDFDTRSSVFAQNQHATLKCMWQQKQLFDSFCAILLEESLLLKIVETTHLDSCQSVKATVNSVHAFIEKFIPVIYKTKESLDSYLLSCNGAITTLGDSFRPYFISEHMEQLLFRNFEVIKEFEEHLFAFCMKDLEKNCVIEVLLSHFGYVFKKGKLIAEELNSAMEARKGSTSPFQEATSCLENLSDLESKFNGIFESTFGHIKDVLEKICLSSDGHASSEESVGNVTACVELFKSAVADLKVNELCAELLETICFAEQLVNHSGNSVGTLSLHMGTRLKHLHAFLDLILSFCDTFLQDFLIMNKTVSVMTQVLAEVLASLYSKGFGISAKDQEDDSTLDISQDATGTGMGEGAGQKDVSDQINDEDQLLGTSEKGGEEQDFSNEVPSKNDKGIEMEQDFAADKFSVSEDSGEDNNEDAEDEQLESAMGETGDDGETIDEKLWNRDEHENPENINEKYESGSSVTDRDASSRELRAKEDTTTNADESGELSPGKLDERNDEIGNQDDLGDTENVEDMNLSKEEAFADPTGLKLEELKEMSDEEMEIDEKEDMDFKEETDPEEQKESDEKRDLDEENANPADENMTAETDKVDGTAERDYSDRDHDVNSEMNLIGTNKNMLEPKISDLSGNDLSIVESATQPNGDFQELVPSSVAPEVANWSNSTDLHNDLAATRSLPSSNTFEMNVMMSDTSNGERLTHNQPNSRLPQNESSFVQKIQPNPYRNVGDALEEWKERVKVSVDLYGDKTEAKGEVEDKNADEYGYVSEFEKGTSQALGPATVEQIDMNISSNNPDGDNLASHVDEVTEMEIENFDSEKFPIEQCAPVLKKSITEKMWISDLDKSPKEGFPEVHGLDDGDLVRLSESLVSVSKSYLSEEVHQLRKLSMSDDDLGKAQDFEEVPGDMKNNATVLWRRYELLTTKLSQELAEQLRLIMEPTLASKLQGDYRTGKRINMKKVIPYIASQYRKDKIWLRRTRPNKRDYQVVIAVDDSRSMSESCCGDVAIKALVTVCRAMSQLEMGNLAVASFGKKGNIRLLHDFDKPFTGEAGVKMISGLTFKQENTIEDEPVVDLLTYLNDMLDAAVSKARLPSGQNPLQQLVLIIGDGRFHEKENLKRCVREVLGKKRMVAFLLLDSLEESIVDLKEFTMQGGVVKFSKYLDSFPFPYYIVLRNIEALPRTLADLLRQWFELMQNLRD